LKSHGGYGKEQREKGAREQKVETFEKLKNKEEVEVVLSD